MGLNAFALTRAAHTDAKGRVKPPKASETNFWQVSASEKDSARFSATEPGSIEEEDSLSSLDDGSDGEGPDGGVGEPGVLRIKDDPEELDPLEDDEIESDEDWDTTEWDKGEVEASCITLLQEVEGASDPKRRQLATGMLVKLVKKHEAARDYIDGGMERMLEKGLRTADQEQTLASKNTIVVPCLMRCRA